MSSNKQYNIFISHSWNYDQHHDKLAKMLDEHPNISHKNYSIDKDNAIEGSNKKVWDEITSSIKMSSGVLAPAGVYASYSDSIKKELKIAQDNGKKIIAIVPRGQEKTSKTVTDVAEETVKWDSTSIVNAIKTYF